LWGLRFAPFYSSDWNTWSPELQELVFNKVSWIPMRIVDQLFSPVVTVAGIVCVLGIVFFAISLMVRNKPRGKAAASVQTPPPVSPEKTPEEEAPVKAEIAEKVEEEAEKVEDEVEEMPDEDKADEKESAESEPKEAKKTDKK
jgi:hypothetical protein